MTGMLEKKVIVISGVGPGLGTTLAHRCARDGAELVLAARTVERLEDLAAKLNDAGHNTLAVRADITDDDDVAALVESVTAHFGKVDVLINNAFRVPSMKPLAGTSFQHIRDAIELSALGALRLIQAFTPALEQSNGSVVNVNSMVLRHSQAKYGAYKMAKSALLSMSQSLATELGEKGIRVNSVAPGYIWGETRKPTSSTKRASTAPPQTRSIRPPRRTPTSSGCPPRTKWRRRSCSWPVICPAASAGRRSTSTAASTTPDG